MVMLLSMALTNAVLAALLAVLAWIVSQAFPRRPALAHGLWLLVLLKLITPPLVPLSVVGLAAVPEEVSAPAIAPAECARCEPPAGDAVPLPASPAEVFVAAPASESAPSWSVVVVSVWLAGVVVIWVLAARRLTRL